MGSDAPVPKMSSVRALILFTVAALGDGLVFFFTWFIFFAAAIAHYAAQVFLETNGWPSWLAGFTLNTVEIVASVAEKVFTPLRVASWAIQAALTAFGIVMAFAVGLIRWMAVVALLFFFGISPFSAKRFLKSLIGIPLATVYVFSIVRDTRKEDKAARKKWETEQKADVERRQQMAQAYLAEARARQEAEAFEQEAEAAEQAEYETYNDNEKILEQEQRAA